MATPSRDPDQPGHRLPVAAPVCRRRLHHGREVGVYFTRQCAARCAMHRHKVYQITLLAENARGTAYWRGPKGKVVRRAFTGAHVWIVPPGLEHAAELLTDSALVVLLVRERFIRRITAEPMTECSLEPLEHYVQADNVVSVLSRLFFERCQHRRKGPARYIVDAGATLAHHLVAAHLAPRAHVRTQRRGLPPSVVERVKQYLREHLLTDCDLDALARSLHMSPGHLSRMFKLSTGCTPSEYLSNLRRELAEEYLTSGRYRSVTEVAHAVGCYDHSHLNKLFRKKYDLPAGLFLRKRAEP